MARAKAFLDKHLERFISRKFMAWITATALCWIGSVTSDNWTAITLAYIGTQALVDIATQWKKGDVLESRIIKMRQAAREKASQLAETVDATEGE